MSIIAEPRQTTEHLATVTPIRVDRDEPRELAYRAHTVEPDRTRQSIAWMEWRVERQLSRMWDEQVSPYRALVLLGSVESAKAVDALDAVFAAAQDVADRRDQVIAGGYLHEYLDRYDDALYELALILGGAS